MLRLNSAEQIGVWKRGEEERTVKLEWVKKSVWICDGRVRVKGKVYKTVPGLPYNSELAALIKRQEAEKR